MLVLGLFFSFIKYCTGYNFVYLRTVIKIGINVRIYLMRSHAKRVHWRVKNVKYYSI